VSDRRRPSGFSMIEMMVVIALMAIAAGLVAWGFGAQRPRQRLLGAAAELQALIHSARQSAMATGRRTSVVVFPSAANGEGSTGRIFVVEDPPDESFYDDAGLPNLDGFDPTNTGVTTGMQGGVLDTMDLPRGVTFGPATGWGSSARMPAPFDVPLSSACTFCQGTDGRGAISFDISGRAKFWKENGRDAMSDTDSLKGASLSIIAADVGEMRTLVLSAPTGTVRVLARELP